MTNFETERRLQLRQIRNRLTEILATVYSNREPMTGLSRCVTGPGKGPERPPAEGWAPFNRFDRWGGFDQTTWFRMTASIPASMKGEHVVALIRANDYSMIPNATGLTEGGESLAYVNGVPAQGLDRNRDEISLVDKAKGGETFEIALEACPSTRFDLHHLFCYADIAVKHNLPFEFYWDATPVLEVCEMIEDNSATKRRLLELLYDCVLSVDLQRIGQNAYFESLGRAQRDLRKGLRAFESAAEWGALVLAGHAHIDTAWLWPLRETRRKCSRTFATILRLMERYPEFHFSCSQPQQYAWIKEDYPELFDQIRDRVKEGRWELCGGAWIEPDHNVPSGESLIRHYLYGNRWFSKEFGKRSRVAWIPDSFGYTWSLPQILRKCQIEAFVTTKIDWSQFTSFPYSYFLWEGIDGTRVPAVMPPLNYNGVTVPADLRKQWASFKQKERVDQLPFPFGYGDGGGGPTMELIERGKRFHNVSFVPRCTFGGVESCVLEMVKRTDLEALPVYNDELYLELHRGCQTTQGRTKRNNRTCERLLREAEFMCALAQHLDGDYPSERLLEAWKIVLTNQFHDLLPGSSLNEVYRQADEDYGRAMELANGAYEEAVRHVVELTDTTGDGLPLLIVNTLPWARRELVRIDLPEIDQPFSVLNDRGEALSWQQTSDGGIVFEASEVPSMGYTVYRLVPGEREAPSTTLQASSNFMENDLVIVELDKNGLITSIYDKLEERELIPRGQTANRLQLFDDRPHDHDAWDIDVNFEDKMWELTEAQAVEVVESGPVRAIVRITRKTEHSTIVQDLTLHAMSSRIDFVTRVDWQEKRTLLKAAFPVDIRSSRAAYEIQFGAIERATHDNWPRDRARFEVPAQRWADLSEGDYGVSLLNDSKYGYDVKENVLRLSLLRSPVDPDPHADEGEHEFTYAIYGHGGDWRNGVVRHAAELNNPLRAEVVEAKYGPLHPLTSFVECDAAHVVVDTVKKAEDSRAIVIRLYEAHGQRGNATLRLSDAPSQVFECDCMEEHDAAIDFFENEIRFYIRPYEIRTIKVVFPD